MNESFNSVFLIIVIIELVDEINGQKYGSIQTSPEYF
jgi:hypothetical protein